MGRDGRVHRAADEKYYWDDLPLWHGTRWLPQKKAAVVHAVDKGLLTLNEAMSRYALSREEFDSWANAVHTVGVEGLRHHHNHKAPADHHSR